MASARGRASVRLAFRYCVCTALIGAVVATIICLLLGLHPVDAIMNGFWLAMTAVGTGGFVPHTSDLIYYHSLPLQFVLSALMIAGAISFAVYAYARAYRFKRVARNAELRVYALWIVLLVAFVTWIMTREGLFTSFGGLMQNGLSTVVSAATTCGMQTVYPEQIGGVITDGVVILVIVAILFGAWRRHQVRTHLASIALDQVLDSSALGAR